MSSSLKAGKRSPLTVGLLAGALVVAGSIGTVAQDAPSLEGQSLVVSNWAEYMPADLPARFTEATGVPVEVAVHAVNEDVLARITAGASDLDVAFVTGAYAQGLAELGYLAPIDHAQIPNLANLYPEANELAYDPGNKISVPYSWGQTGLCYRSDLLSEAPDSWMDLLQPSDEVAKKTTMMATERWMMLPAQKALGFSVNTTDPAQMEQVKELLIAAKPTLLAYDDTTFYTRLVTGEASLVEAWDGWCNLGIADNPDIRFVVPKEGTDLWADTMVIMADSQNKEAAHAFIDFVLQPENQRWVSEAYHYKVPNKPAMDGLAAAEYERYPSLNVTPAELLESEELVDLGEAQPMYTQIATEVLASQ